LNGYAVLKRVATSVVASINMIVARKKIYISVEIMRYK